MLKRATFVSIAYLVLAATGCARRYQPAVLVPTDAQEEVVYLKSGGEVRGRLVERSPERGVVLRLQDGSLRTIGNRELEYAGLPGTGSVHIEAAAPGRIRLDREELGRAPLDVRNVVAGPHQVEVTYDAGGSSDADLIVQAGRASSVALPLPTVETVSAYREGMHLTLGGGLQGGNTLYDEALFGIAIHAGITIGLGPRFDFQALGQIGLGPDLAGDYVWYEIGASAGLRWNLSSVYSMELAARLSLMQSENDVTMYNRFGSNDYRHEAAISPALGAHVSFFSLRLGADRSYELTLWHALMAGKVYDEEYGADWATSFRTGLSLLHVFP